MSIYSIIFLSVLVLNIIFLIAMILAERKQTNTILSWFVVFTFLPIVGFVLYLLFGGGLSFTTKRLIKRKKHYTNDYYKFVSWQRVNFSELRQQNEQFDYAYDLINFVKTKDECNFTVGNKVEVFTNGLQKIERLKQDLKNAKHSINIEYYIFANDKVGKEIMDILIEKAKSGVKVKLIYDSVGSIKTPRHFFLKLKLAGGEVAEFFPPMLGIKLLNFKINYRNHRKIVVIDGKIAYTGGINIRDDHLGRKKRVSPWRDTHIRIEGRAVWDLQNVFFNDYRCVKLSKLDPKTLSKEGYFPQNTLKDVGNVGVQIITSGPENDDKNIEDAYIKMINLAQKSIYIQTPYFIPDETFIKALELAQKSGVKIYLMLPKKPDKKMVYYVTLSYVKRLLDIGVKVYLYNGFIHSKTLVVDDIATSIGTCNMDNRSFALNFEITAIMYGKDFANQNKEIFKNDIKNSELLSKQTFKRRFLSSKIMQAICRLFSPLM